MKYEIFERPEIHYIGLKLEVNLNSIEKSNIGGLWSDLFKEEDQLNIDRSSECIGLEKYNDDTMKTGIFDYYALAPSTKMTDDEGYYSYVTLPASKYVKFPVNFKELGPKKFQEVYKYIKENKINVDYSFDMELYPLDFNPEDENAEMFIMFKLNE